MNGTAQRVCGAPPIRSPAHQRAIGKKKAGLAGQPALQIALRSLSESHPYPYTQCDSRAPRRHRMLGNRNVLFLIIGALIVVVAVLGYNLYQTKKQPEGLQINVGPNGLKIENK
jgi:hypothetical protein